MLQILASSMFYSYLMLFFLTEFEYAFVFANKHFYSNEKWLLTCQIANGEIKPINLEVGVSSSNEYDKVIQFNNVLFFGLQMEV